MYEYIEVDVLKKKEFQWENPKNVETISEFKKILKSLSYKMTDIIFKDDSQTDSWRDMKYFWGEESEFTVLVKRTDDYGSVGLFKLRFKLE